MYEHAIGKFKRWLSGKDKIEPESEAPRSPRTVGPEVPGHANSATYPGTIIRIVLQGQRTTAQEDGKLSPVASTCGSARVVRYGSDGVAVEFEFRDEEDRANFGTFLAAIPPPPATTAPPDATSLRDG